MDLHGLIEASFKECQGRGELMIAAHKTLEIPPRCTNPEQTRRYRRESRQDYMMVEKGALAARNPEPTHVFCFR